MRLSLIAETSTAMRLTRRRRPDEKLATGRSNGPAYATVYATPWTLAELSSNDVLKAPRRTVTRVRKRPLVDDVQVLPPWVLERGSNRQDLWMGRLLV